MSTIAYNCPRCGSPLEFSGKSGRLECASCGSSYETDDIEAMNPVQEAEEGTRFERPTETLEGSIADGIQGYICQGCGAELMTENTTTATECPYCGRTTVLPDRIEGGIKPEKIIPFTVAKEQAQKQFEEYFKGKKLLPNIFLNSRNRIAEIRKLYVPYWLFDCDADANIVYDAERDYTYRQGDWEITRTEHYMVRRKGGMGFNDIPVDGSEKMDNKITESLEPYDLSEAVSFSPSVLAGALADHADVDADRCEARVVERVERSVSQAMRNTVYGYTRVMERSSNIRTKGGRVTPVLMPIWVITTEKEGKIYTFAINGQTGKLTCNVPTDKKKAFVWGAGVFAGVFGIAALVLHLLEQLADGTLLFAGIAAAIAAFAVVAILNAQLKQAVYRSEAGDYVRKGSFNLEVSYDKFLYETTRRRKIETNNNK